MLFGLLCFLIPKPVVEIRFFVFGVWLVYIANRGLSITPSFIPWGL
jgi:hypothetical protein